jgi:protein-S-isoprenylcysteine O-methyltransferase Ste14
LLGAVLLGVPAVGVGISLSPTIEVVAAIVLAAAGIAVAILQTQTAFRARDSNATLLLLISSVSIAAAMVLAGVYAVGEAREVNWLSIPQMVKSHGVLNAFGFAFCGLLGNVLATTHHQKLESDRKLERI